MWIIRIAKKKQGHPSHLTPRADREYTVLCMASRPSGQTWPISGPNGICGSGGTRMKSCMKFCSLKHTHVFDCCRDLDVVVDALDKSISTPEVMLGIDWDESKHEFRLFYNCSRSSISRVEAVSQCSKESSGIASAQQCCQSAVVELLFGLTLIDMTWPPCGHRSPVMLDFNFKLCGSEKTQTQPWIDRGLLLFTSGGVNLMVDKWWKHGSNTHQEGLLSFKDSAWTGSLPCDSCGPTAP